MFFGLKVRFLIISAGRAIYGNEIADALGRALAYASSDWKELLGRLKKRKLDPKEAAVVAAAWLRDRAPADRLGFPIKQAMDSVSADLQYELNRDRGLKVAYLKLNEVMTEEGIFIDYGQTERADGVAAS